MKKKENNISLLLGVPGLILQIAGYFMTSAAQQQGAPTLMGNGITLVGTILLISGLNPEGRSRATPGLHKEAEHADRF